MHEGRVTASSKGTRHGRLSCVPAVLVIGIGLGLGARDLWHRPHGKPPPDPVPVDRWRAIDAGIFRGNKGQQVLSRPWARPIALSPALTEAAMRVCSCLMLGACMQ